MELRYGTGCMRKDGFLCDELFISPMLYLFYSPFYVLTNFLMGRNYCWGSVRMWDSSMFEVMCSHSDIRGSPHWDELG